MIGTVHLAIADILEPGTIALLIPVVAIMIPIVALMNHHQQKMAEIIHGRRHKELIQKELDEMRAEIGHLRSTIATQALALEGLANRRPLAGTSDTDSLAQRLG